MVKFTKTNQIDALERTGYVDLWEEIGDEFSSEDEFVQLERRLERVSKEMEQELLPILYNFCKDISKRVKDSFLALLESYLEQGRFSRRMFNYLLEKGLIYPSFIIANGSQALDLLHHYGFKDVKVNPENIIVTFQLPKAVAHFWWKGGVNTWGEQAKDLGGMVIEWGDFYRKLMPYVWETIGYYENEEGLDLCRINACGEHDPHNYYYIWEVKRW